VILYAPDRGVLYDGRTLDATGIGGGITARLSMVAALAALGHDVTAYVDCPAPVDHGGVRYRPLDTLTQVDCDVLVAIATGAATSLALPQGVPVNARLRIAWFQGIKSHRIEIEPLAPDYIYVASNFLRDAFVERWGLPPERVFVCYNGIQQERFEVAAADERTPSRDPFALVYIGPRAKGLDAAIRIQRRLRAEDPRYHLDVLGGNRLWSLPDPPTPDEPGVRWVGLLGQSDLVPRLFGYEYCLAPQAMEEGFGIAVQEAKRAGVIVFASEVGAFGELIRTGQDGFLISEPHPSPAAEDHVVRVILQLAGDPAERARLRVNAMRTPWSWTLAARTWTAHWDHLLGRSRSSTEPPPGGESFLDLPDGRHFTSTGYYEPGVYPLSPMHDRLGAARGDDHATHGPQGGAGRAGSRP
jgi:glycosyltransferase involved in cell wall biosynthesis